MLNVAEQNMIGDNEDFAESQMTIEECNNIRLFAFGDVLKYSHRCGYCDSTKAPIPYEQMYGPGAHGWDCCPDCGGV